MREREKDKKINKTIYLPKRTKERDTETDRQTDRRQKQIQSIIYKGDGNMKTRRERGGEREIEIEKDTQTDGQMEKMIKRKHLNKERER